MLVSIDFLRARNCGQIDLAVMKPQRGEWYLQVIEAKTSVGATRSQLGRLYKSVDLLAKILNVTGGLEQIICQNQGECLSFKGN